MDEALRRTLSGNLYRVKGYIVIPYDEYVRAIDEEDAEDIVFEKLENYYMEDDEIIIDEVIIQEDE